MTGNTAISGGKARFAILHLQIHIQGIIVCQGRAPGYLSDFVLM